MPHHIVNAEAFVRIATLHVAVPDWHQNFTAGDRLQKTQMLYVNYEQINTFSKIFNM